jgi:hypothetical protein
MNQSEMSTPLGMLEIAGVTPENGMNGSIAFELGERCITLGGEEVVCTELSDKLRGYQCARFSDGAWRYNRPHDRGRCTGSPWDHPLNIVPRFPSV